MSSGSDGVSEAIGREAEVVIQFVRRPRYDVPERVIHAADLGQAQRNRRRIRAQAGSRPPVVLLAIQAVLAATAADARERAANLEDAPVLSGTGTMRYVGTAVGLAGLIADIEMAEVADGVVVWSACPDGSELIMDETVPSLTKHRAHALGASASPLSVHAADGHRSLRLAE